MKPTINFETFMNLDLRVGKVLAIEDVAGSEKLYKMAVDLGPEYGTRTIFAGLKPWYKKSQLKGKQFVFVANLEPRRMMGSESQGMMLAVDPPGGEASDEEKPLLLPAPKAAKPGAGLR
jgi:methionine--tRNA ligase beta chain